MATFRERMRNWVERMQYTYRLVIMNNETFEEMGSYRLSLMNVYIVASTLVVVIASIVIVLVAFTPLKRYLPGYGDGNDQQMVMALSKEVAQMEKVMGVQEKYIESMRRMLTGEVRTEEDLPPLEETTLDSVDGVEVSEAEKQLRNEVELEAVGLLAQRGGAKSADINRRDTPLEQLYFVAPLTGEISSPFMSEKGHYGVDVLAPKNTPVKAAMDGYVFLSDWTLETGNTIGIQHANSVVTIYKHNSALLKKVGSRVRAGEAIAIIGNTGTLTDGPHLHFELWYRGIPVDPHEYIAF